MDSLFVGDDLSADHFCYLVKMQSNSNACFYFILQKCHVKKKDIRKFLDGIYVSDKGTITEE
jgi:hypothetical protein